MIEPRSVSIAFKDDLSHRRTSIQFASPVKPNTIGYSSRASSVRRKRLSSPPPPPVFQPRVSFDTFSDKRDSTAVTEIFSYTLTRKHKDYEYTKRSRTFLCGLDANEHSDHALEWLFDELVDDGDEIVCLRVVERDSKIAGEASVEDGRYRDEAEALMSRIQEKNRENKAVNLILEFSVGKVQKTIDDMIHLYEPAILIVGTKGRSLGGIQGLLPGSVSKYCLQHSPVPVIVVRPNVKRDKKKRKRKGDPNRYAYRELLEKSGYVDGDLHEQDFKDEKTSAEGKEAEASAVADAIGYDPRTGIARLSISEAQETQKSSTSRSGESSPEDMKSPGIVMKSPRMRDENSPDESEESSEDEDEDETDGEIEAVPGHILLRESGEDQKIDGVS